MDKRASRSPVLLRESRYKESGARRREDVCRREKQIN